MVLAVVAAAMQYLYSMGANLEDCLGLIKFLLWSDCLITKISTMGDNSLTNCLAY